MVIIDEKYTLLPPPPYIPVGPLSPPPFPAQFPRTPTTLSTIPPHILLHIVHQTLPQTAGVFDGEGKIERQRKTLYWMSVGLRLVSRALYIACMHVLRSTYLPAYSSLVRAPYTSDPFPLSAPSPTTSAYAYMSPSALVSPVNAVQRETQVLDLFLALKVREDVWADDTELHLERQESFRDLFDLNQPRARTEDLVRMYGVQAGVIAAPGGTSTYACSAVTRGPRGKALPFGALSVSFSSRRVGLVLSMKGSKRTAVEVARERDERLEVAAKRLVKELMVWLDDCQ